MDIEQTLFLLEPMLSAYVKDEEELFEYKSMIESTVDCFLINTSKGVLDNFEHTELPDNISIYAVDCNFLNAFKNNKINIKLINPRLSKVWISSMDTRFDFKKVLQDIKELKLTGFLEIYSKFLDINGIMYFKSGKLLSVKFNDINDEEALPLLMKSISGKVFTLNFYKLPEDMIEVYAGYSKLESIEEDESLHNISFLSKSKNMLFQGMFPSGYFHIYMENNKVFFYILNNEIKDKIDIYEPFYLASFSIDKKFMDLDLDTYINAYQSANVMVKPTSADKNFVFFCPFCWNPVPQEAKICPSCNANIENFTKLPYDIKLIIALAHPIADYRITALNVIKAKNIHTAKAFIKSLILNDDNPMVVQSALNTLFGIMGRESCEFISYISNNHEYTIVKSFATDLYRRYCL